MTKKSLILGAAIASTLSSGAALAVDGLSANVGIVSEYYFRGVQQTDGASGNGGIDYEHDSGFYVGFWGGDVGGHTDDGSGGELGIEIDTYAGFAGEAGDFGYSIGYTHYGYTGTFDTEYNEVNLGASLNDFAIDVAIGSRDEPGGTDQDYNFVALSYGTGPFSVTYGAWGDDFAGAYIEAGLSTDVGGADVGVSFINGDPDDDASKNVMTDGTALVFSLSKGFDL
jgi:uncharacterized protein (TIGR02001 family)